MEIESVVAICALFIGLPWIILHYVTKWKTSATLTTDDEALLEELYQLARRLDERMDTVERLVASEHPEFHPAVPMPNREIDNQPLREIERMRARSTDRSLR
jgi:phage shock protein B